MRFTYTCTFVGFMLALGVRGAVKSEAAMMAPTTKATVVKKPKTFCMRVRELYMMGDTGPSVRWIDARLSVRPSLLASAVG